MKIRLPWGLCRSASRRAGPSWRLIRNDGGHATGCHSEQASNVRLSARRRKFVLGFLRPAMRAAMVPDTPALKAALLCFFSAGAASVRSLGPVGSCRRMGPANAISVSLC